MADDAIDYVAAARAKAKGGKKPKAAVATVDEPSRTAPAPAPAPAPAAGGAGTAAAPAAGGAGSAAAVEKDDFDPTTMRTSLMWSFADILYQFLEAAAVVWPKDAVIADWRAKFGGTAAAADDATREAFFGKLIDGFHETFKEHYSAIATQDAALFDDESIPWLAAVHAKAKFREAHPQIRKQVWEYASFLARFSNMYAMYAKCPDGLLGHIHRLALKLGTKLQRGEMNMADLNPLTLGEHLMKVLTPEELSKFGKSMMNESSLEGMISMLQSMVGTLGGGAAWMGDTKDLLAMAASAGGGGGGSE